MSPQYGSNEVSVEEHLENINGGNTGDNMTRVYHSRNSYGSARRSFRTSRSRGDGTVSGPQVELVDGGEEFDEEPEAPIVDSRLTAAAENVRETRREARQENRPEGRTAARTETRLEGARETRQETRFEGSRETRQEARFDGSRETRTEAPRREAAQRRTQQGQQAGTDRQGRQPIQQGRARTESQSRNTQGQPPARAAQTERAAQSVPVDISDEDLLARIDDFRTQAQQLQTLINAKQTRAKELESLVGEQEAKNQKLQAEYSKRQKEASGIITGVEEQLERMLQSLRDDMDDMEANITENVADKVAQTAKQTEGLQESLAAINKKLDAKQDNGDIKESIEELTKALDATKTEITDSVHSENVKVYRNIQDLLKEDNSNEELELSLEVWYRILKKRLSVTMTIMIINMGLAVVLILAILGVF